jgi:REP element-mobilizing transposase RayT
MKAKVIKHFVGISDLVITRRHLPHWTANNVAYFITFRTISGALSREEQILVLNMIKEGASKYYYLYAVVVMPDHVHLILTPKEEYSLSRIMKGIKGKSARRINANRNEKGSVWQDESFDRILRNEDELFEKFNYILNNPFKAGLTDDPWNYYGWYFNEKLKK